MYNLKKVYATLSFQDDAISLTVLENNETTNCLYSNSIKIQYIDADFNFVNVHKIKEVISYLTENCDRFLGITIKKYIVNFDNIPLTNKNTEADPTFLTNLKNILNESNIVALNIISNSLYFSHEDGINGQAYIGTNSTYVYEYNDESKAVDLHVIPYGTKWAIENIQHMLKIDGHEAEVISFINNLQNLKLVNDKIPFINKHSNKYCELTEIDIDVFEKAVNIVFSALFNNILKVNNKIKYSVYSCDFIHTVLLSITCEHSAFIFNKVNDITGLENSNVGTILLAHDFVTMNQIANNNIEYSITPYIDSIQVDKQIKDDILVSIGVITTRWAAKLGG